VRAPDPAWRLAEPKVITMAAAAPRSSPHPSDRLGAAAAALAAALDDAGRPAASPSHAVVAAEVVSACRGALYTCLMELGWVPPKTVLAGMQLDLLLRGEGVGAGFDAPVELPQQTDRRRGYLSPAQSDVA
jgi:hypothetical protein